MLGTHQVITSCPGLFLRFQYKLSTGSSCLFQFVFLLKELYHKVSRGLKKDCYTQILDTLMRWEPLRVDSNLRFLRNDSEKIRVAIQGSSNLLIFNTIGLQYLVAQLWKISSSYTFDIYFLLVNKGTKGGGQVFHFRQILNKREYLCYRNYNYE